MLRRIACGTLLCALAALAGACGTTTTAPTETPTPITETFNGTLNPASSNVHTVVAALTGGAVTATLTTVGPDPTKTVGFSLGTFNPTTSVCTVIFDNPAALQGAVFNATAATAGFYCVRVYDNGSVAAAVADGSASSFTYTVTVVHPQ
jgi:hypothetical protein